MKTIAVILAGGIGQRMNSEIPKQFMLLEGKEILLYSLETFSNCEKIDEIVLVSHPDYKEKCAELISSHSINKIVAIIDGGCTRQESVHNAIKEVNSKNDECIVLVHDSARPKVTEKIILDNIEAVKKYGTCTTAIPVVDSVYFVEENSVSSCLNRDKIYLAQTPQSGLLSIFLKAYKTTTETYTDDAGLFSSIGEKPHIVLGDVANSKITVITDIKN